MPNIRFGDHTTTFNRIEKNLKNYLKLVCLTRMLAVLSRSRTSLIFSTKKRIRICSIKQYETQLLCLSIPMVIKILNEKTEPVIFELEKYIIINSGKTGL